MANASARGARAAEKFAGLDRPGAVDVQDAWASAALRRSNLRVRTLIGLRWSLIAGEAALLLTAYAGGYALPYGLCAATIGIMAWINLLTGVAWPGRREMPDHEAVVQLSVDVAQLSVLLGLTGGTANPFILFLIAPPTLAAATMPLRPMLVLGALASAASVLLAFMSLPYPSPDPALSLEFRLVAAAANVAGIALIAGYVRQAAAAAARLSLALDAAQQTLAREQRLSALGGLAAAAAHELGTPLATISIVAKELAREAPNLAVKDDAELLIAQAERCREILRRLTETAGRTGDELHERLSLRQLVEEVIEPHAGVKDVRVEAIVAAARGAKAPDIRRMPEITHAVNAFVENAVDFAASEVLVTARFDTETVSVEVRDDGPGFAPEVLAKLGEPYVTTRPGAEGSRTGHVGMGLGFFIAKTLLERTGAQVTFQNVRPRGAMVCARWPRSAVEVR